MGKKRKEEYSHKTWIKILSIISTLWILGNMGWGVYTMVAGYQLNWGFYPDKLTPNIIPSFNATGLNETRVDIPVYVYNNGSIGFDITNLEIDISISNATEEITSASTPIGNIPWGNTTIFNVSLVKEDTLTLMQKLNSTGPLMLDIFFTVTYIATTVTLNLTIDLPGGLLFP
ncbi:MAG: hypothetical protein ACFFCS_21265 [Candidatus Hodarchaeota archaeon]